MSSPEGLVPSLDQPHVLDVRQLDAETILIEGDRDSLTLLSDILRAVAQGGDCGFSLSPHGAGSDHFAEGSEYGIYVHRTPCEQHQ